MLFFSFLLMAASLALLTCILWAGRAHVRMANAGPRPAEDPAFRPFTEGWPSLALIIPMHGDRPGMAAALDSLITQDYPEARVVLVTEDAADPATALAAQLAEDAPHVDHVLAGHAATTAQKLHNQLAGMAFLQQRGAAPEVWAFADSTHLAPRGMLRELVSPMANPCVMATTGYHRVRAEDAALPTLMHAAAVLALHLMQGLPRLCQAWGGAMAVRRDAFERCEVASLWAAAIVDDVTLTARLKQRGERLVNASRACLVTPLAHQTRQGFMAWLIRQIHYLRFCMPWLWAAAGAGFLALGGAPLLAGMAVVGWIFGLGGGGLALVGGLYFVLAGALLLWARRLLPERPPLARWLLAGGGAAVSALAAYGLTWTRRRMVWGTKAYVAGWGGGVRRVKSLDSSP